MTFFLDSLFHPLKNLSNSLKLFTSISDKNPGKTKIIRNDVKLWFTTWANQKSSCEGREVLKSVLRTSRKIEFSQKPLKFSQIIFWNFQLGISGTSDWVSEILLLFLVGWLIILHYSTKKEVVHGYRWSFLCLSRATRFDFLRESRFLRGYFFQQNLSTQCL